MNEAKAESSTHIDQGRPMHNDLPVISIVRRAFYLPVRYPWAFIRLGAIPALVTISIQISATAIVAFGMLNRVAPGWVLLADTFVYVPFAVGWTRLAMDGPARIAGRSAFHFRRIEGYYLFAVAVFFLSWLFVLLPLYELRQLAIRSLNFELGLMSDILTVAGLLVLAICLTRSLYVLPALAVNQYKGLVAIWRLTKCSLERLLVLEALAHLPYLVALWILAGLTKPYYPLVERAAVNIAESIAWMFGQAFIVGTIALAYKHSSLRSRIADSH
jgi:hypothetical protein